MSVDRLKELVAIPSYSGEEVKAQLYIKQQLQSSGLEPFDQGGNLLLHLKGRDQKRALIFNGHVDVVNIGDESKWLHPPWSGHIEDGKMYGRGTSDMKAGVVAIMSIAETLATQGSLPTDVWFSFVTKEEVDGSGTESFVKWFEEQGYKDQYSDLAVLIAEPTTLEVAKYGHRGNFFLKAVIEGIAAHSSRPEEIKTHAIWEMTQFIQDLRLRSALWKERFKESEFPPPTIVPTSISALSLSPNRTPEFCESVFDLRTIPGFHNEAFEEVKQMAQKLGISIEFMYPPAPVGYTRPDARIIQAVQKVVQPVSLEINVASNDLGFFTSVGIEGVVYGPGDMKLAHRTDEYVEIEQLEKATKTFLEIYESWSNL